MKNRLIVLMFLSVWYSCKQNATNPVTGDSFWLKTSAPDSVSFMKILVSTGQTILACTGDYPYQALYDGYTSLWITSLACDYTMYMYATSDLGGIYKSRQPVK